MTPATAPEKPPAPELETALTEADRKLISVLDAAIEKAAAGDEEALDSLAAAFDKLDDAKREAASDYGRAKPKQFDWPAAERAAKNAREEAAKLDVNKQAAARGMTAVPYPAGPGGGWSAEHVSSYETALKKAAAEVQFRDQREPRPVGVFKKKEMAAWDAKTAELQSTAAGWEKEIEWRGKALSAASKAREPQDAAHTAKAKAAFELAHLPTVEKAEPLRARSEAHIREHARLRAKIEQLFDKEQRQKLDQKEGDFGQGHGR